MQRTQTCQNSKIPGEAGEQSCVFAISPQTDTKTLQVMFLQDAMLSNSYLAYRRAHPKMSKSSYIDLYVREACERHNFYTRGQSSHQISGSAMERAAHQAVGKKSLADNGHRLVHAGQVHWLKRGRSQVIVPAGTTDSKPMKRGGNCIVCLQQLGPFAEGLREDFCPQQIFTGSASEKDAVSKTYSLGSYSTRVGQSIYRCVECAANPLQGYGTTGNMHLECFPHHPAHFNAKKDPAWNAEKLACVQACGHQ